MRTKNILILTLGTAVITANIALSKQDGQRCLDYPIEFAQNLSIFESRPTLRLLFHSGYLLNMKNDQGKTVKCILEKSYKNDNISFYQMSLKAENKKILLFKYKFRADDEEQLNYIIYLYIKDMDSGMATEMKYDPENSTRSYGKMIGGFGEMAQYMFNLDELNKAMRKNEE
jgi:hypothetical protein